MQDFVVQHVKPRYLKKFMDENRINLTAMSLFTYEVKDGGISTASLSLFMNEQKALSSEAQLSLFHILEFCRSEKELAGGPSVDFNAPAMRKRFRDFLRARSRAEVIRTEAETAETAGAERA